MVPSSSAVLSRSSPTATRVGLYFEEDFGFWLASSGRSLFKKPRRIYSCNGSIPAAQTEHLLNCAPTQHNPAHARGALQGQNKTEIAERFGAERVHEWRRSYVGRPPPLDEMDERFPGRDRRYAGLSQDALPRSESLEDTVKRFIPYWTETLAPQLTARGTVLVVAHGNSLRAVVKYLQKMKDSEIANLEIPTGIPFLYHLDAKLRFVDRHFL